MDRGTCPPQHHYSTTPDGDPAAGIRLLGSRDPIVQGLPSAIPPFPDRPQRRQYYLNLCARCRHCGQSGPLADGSVARIDIALVCARGPADIRQPVEQGPGMRSHASGVYNAELVIQMNQLNPGEDIVDIAPVVCSFKINGDAASTKSTHHFEQYRCRQRPHSVHGQRIPELQRRFLAAVLDGPILCAELRLGAKTVYFKVRTPRERNQRLKASSPGRWDRLGTTPSEQMRLQVRPGGF